MFFVKGMIVNVFVFAGQTVSVAMTLFHHYIMKAAIDKA